jgi:riboflavin synthase alpha subunit
VEHESSKKGGAAKLQLRLPNKYKEQLLRKGAVALGGEEILVGEYNKGVEFERLISEMNGQTFRGKESVGFWVEGDIEIDGKQVQVKFNGAQIVVERTLHRLQREARARK